MSTVLLEVRDLKVCYGFRTAVSDLSFEIGVGGATGLLGINGAGKTSTLHALLGIVRPSGGEVRLFGEGPGKPKYFARLGFAPDEGWPPEHLNGRSYLEFVAGFRIKDRYRRRAAVEEELACFDIEPEKPVRHYSKGMKRRLVLAQAFIGNPGLLILDEPLSGLDPLLIVKLRERIEHYLKNGGSLLFSSHILTEVEKVCQEVIILSKGKPVLKASVAQIMAEFGSVEKAFTTKAGAGQ